MYNCSASTPIRVSGALKFRFFAQGFQYFRPLNGHDGSTLSVPSSSYVSHVKTNKKAECYAYIYIHILYSRIYILLILLFLYDRNLTCFVFLQYVCQQCGKCSLSMINEMIIICIMC